MNDKRGNTAMKTMKPTIVLLATGAWYARRWGSQSPSQRKMTNANPTEMLSTCTQQCKTLAPNPPTEILWYGTRAMQIRHSLGN